MPRIASLNILLESEGKDYLAELYGKVIENVQKTLVSAGMKNTDLSGDPASGSVEAKRLANATSQDYGTARTNGKGNAIKASTVTVAIDQDKEIVEELEEKDIKLYGVDGVLEKRAQNHVLRMAAELDTAFFKAAADAAAQATLTATAVDERLEAAIQALENTKNAFVDGVPRSLMHLVCSTSVYGSIRNALDKMARSNIDTAAEEFWAWHGVRAYSCVNLPAGCDFLVMAQGAVAQPVTADQYKAEKIPLSNAYGVELYEHARSQVSNPLYRRTSHH